MNNSRFAISVHILTLLDQMKGEWVSSELIAGSININPVLVRKELINLRKQGFIQSKEGKNGGSSLAKNSADISLADIYQSVKQKYLLGTNKNEPNPACPVGKQINVHLDKLYSEVEDAMLAKLAAQSLEKFSKKFK